MHIIEKLIGNQQEKNLMDILAKKTYLFQFIITAKCDGKLVRRKGEEQEVICMTKPTNLPVAHRYQTRNMHKQRCQDNLLPLSQTLGREALMHQPHQLFPTLQSI